MKIPKDFDFGTRELEANEELEAVSWAENNGWVSRKIAYVGRRGCPDRLFMGHGHLLICEFKKPSRRAAKDGGKSGGQTKEAQRAAEVGVTIPTFYSSKECIEFLRSKMIMSLLS